MHKKLNAAVEQISNDRTDFANAAASVVDHMAKARANMSASEYASYRKELLSKLEQLGILPQLSLTWLCGHFEALLVHPGDYSFAKSRLEPFANSSHDADSIFARYALDHFHDYSDGETLSLPQITLMREKLAAHGSPVCNDMEDIWVASRGYPMQSTTQISTAGADWVENLANASQQLTKTAQNGQLHMPKRSQLWIVDRLVAHPEFLTLISTPNGQVSRQYLVSEINAAMKPDAHGVVDLGTRYQVWKCMYDSFSILSDGGNVSFDPQRLVHEVYGPSCSLASLTKARRQSH